MPFCGVPQPPEQNARAAIIPAPVEKTVSYGGGTALGPAAILWSSAYMELYDELLDYEPICKGILTQKALDCSGDMEAILDRIEAAVDAQLEAGRLPALVGGEHTVTLGALRALCQRHGTGFTVLVLDAHLDLREAYQGRKLSHACVMKRALDMGLKVRHLGVRSCSQDEAILVKERGLNPVWAREVLEGGDWLDKALDGIEGPVYISLDVDGLDPSTMPATGTPEPGGLSWHQASNWLLRICQQHPVLGLDLVELAPMAAQPAWGFTGARLLYRALGAALKDWS